MAIRFGQQKQFVNAFRAKQFALFEAIEGVSMASTLLRAALGISATASELRCQSVRPAEQRYR